MSFGTGFLTGLAGSLEKGVQAGIDRHMDDLSNAKKYMRERRNQEEARYRKDVKKYKETIEDLASYVDTENLPEGATPYDIAGAYFENSLGGSVREAEAAIVKFRDAKDKLGDAGAKIVFDKANTQGLGAEDVGKQFVDAIDFDFIKGSEQKGTGLFFKNVDIREKAAESVTIPVDEQMSAMERGKVEGLGTRGAFTTETEYAQQQELIKLKINQARADYEKTLTEGDMKDAMSFNEYKGQIITRTQDILQGEYKIPVNENGEFDLKTASEQVDDLSAVYTDIVKLSTQQGVAAKGTLVDTKNLTQIVAKASLRGRDGNYVVGTQVPHKDTPLEIGNVYGLTNPSGKLEYNLYLGEDFGEGKFVPLYGQ